MPLSNSCTIKAFKDNVAAEIRAGKKNDQAVAIAHDALRKACEAAGKDIPNTVKKIATVEKEKTLVDEALENIRKTASGWSYVVLKEELAKGAYKGPDKKKKKTEKGFLQGHPDGGMHAHGLNRRSSKTSDDGAHMHVFVLPGTEEMLVTHSSGAHEHVISDDGGSTREDGAHSHTIYISSVGEFETSIGGEHAHALMVETSGFGGEHKHTLKLPDGTVIESLSVAEYVERFINIKESEPTYLPHAWWITDAFNEIRSLQDEIEWLYAQNTTEFEILMEKFAKTGEIPALPTTFWRVESVEKDQILCGLDGFDALLEASLAEGVTVEKGDVVEVEHPARIVGVSKCSQPSSVEVVALTIEHIERIKEATDCVEFKGAEDARLVFVASTPSQIELARKEAIVGPDGEIFRDQYLKRIGIEAKEVAKGFAIPVSCETPDEDTIDLWRDNLLKELARFPHAHVVALGKIAKEALGPLAKFYLPHPAAIRKTGETKEIARKSKQIRAALDTVQENAKNAPSSGTEPSHGTTERTLAESVSGQRELLSFRVSKDQIRSEEQVVYCVAVDPYQFDLHDDWISPYETQKTAWAFQENSRIIGLRHKDFADATLVETHLVEYPEGQHELAMKNEPHSVFRRQFGKDVVHSGTWIVGIRLGDELWELHKQGELDSVSIGGFSYRIPCSKDAIPEVTFIDQGPITKFAQ